MRRLNKYKLYRKEDYIMAIQWDCTNKAEVVAFAKAINYGRVDFHEKNTKLVFDFGERGRITVDYLTYLTINTETERITVKTREEMKRFQEVDKNEETIPFQAG